MRSWNCSFASAALWKKAKGSVVHTGHLFNETILGITKKSIALIILGNNFYPNKVCTCTLHRIPIDYLRNENELFKKPSKPSSSYECTGHFYSNQAFTAINCAHMSLYNIY